MKNRLLAFVDSSVIRFSAVGALVLGFTSQASAQSQVEGEISVQRFDPAPGPGNFLTTRSASGIEGHLAWTAGLFVNYGFEPFIIKRCDNEDCSTSTTIPVVENMVTGDILASFSLIERLQIGLKIPVSWAKGQGLQQGESGGEAIVEPLEGGLSKTGLGDIQLEAKGRFYGNPGEIISLGGFLYGTAPTGVATAPDSYIGNWSPTFGLGFIFDGTVGPLSYGANLGGLFRKAAVIGGSSLGPEARWGVGAGFAVSPVVQVVADAFGSTNFGNDLGANSVEVDGAFKILPLGKQLTFIVGGGAGALKGIGSPTARAFFGVSYNATVLDRDGDGIPDDADACADAPEDLDGFEDGDGCPELDNDQDGLPDDADKCPDQVEDLDNFEDSDGCPDEDNDKDGIPDISDACPDKPETINGFEDADGCPDVVDTDSDGVPDDVDQCPNEPEDTDGFEDTDGCPEPDNDKDGIPDNGDECINEPEDGKGEGRLKEDGCPEDA